MSAPTTTATKNGGAAVMEPQQETQGLERASDRTPAIITTPEEYVTALKKWEGRYHVLTPFTNISGIAPQHGIIVSQVRINPDDSKTGAGEVYSGLPFLGKDEVALAKIGLRKLAECGAISTSTVRTDPRTQMFYWEVKAIASYRGIDGAIVTREATVEWDLRDGSPRLKGWTPQQISEGRKNGLRNAEARAINAAIRECGCGIKQKYSKAELQKPFIVLRVMFQPDMSDPETKRLVTERALGGTRALYPGTPAAAPHAVDAIEGETVSHEPRHIGSGSTAPPAETAKAPETKPAEDQPPTKDAVKIAKIESFAGETKGRKWTKYTIVDSNGVAYSTFDKQHFEDATRFKGSDTWVEIVAETKGEHTNIIEIVEAGTEPALPGMEAL